MMHLFFSVLIFAAQPHWAKTQTQILQSEVEKRIQKDTPQECGADPKVNIVNFELFDFNSDGKDEAVVVAYTCMGGTGGPDIQMVYTRTDDGGLAEVPVPDIDSRHFEKLFGNRNYTLSPRGGFLVATWTDTSLREKPLVVRYKWEKNKFAVASIEESKPFKTSFDCSKAAKEIERAICYVKPLAELDIELANIYKQTLEELKPDQIVSLKNSQMAWSMKRDKECVIYKWWVECIQKAYVDRIASLKKQKAK